MLTDLLKSLFKSKPVQLIKGDPVVYDWSWYQASDPTVTKVGNQWQMFFTSMQNYKLHIVQSTSSDFKNWTFKGPIISPTEDAVETPSYIRFSKNNSVVERIYYTQWKYGPPHNYSVGFAEKIGRDWINYIGPVLKAENDWEKDTSGTILGDQSVFMWKDKFYMAYQVGKDNVTSLAVAESDDGIVWPANRRKLIGKRIDGNLPNGPYHVSVKVSDKIYYYGWMPNTDLTKQGLYRMESTNPFDVPQNPKLLLAENATSWMTPKDKSKQITHELGLFGCDVINNGKDYLFFHYVNQNSSKDNVASIGMVQL